MATTSELALDKTTDIVEEQKNQVELETLFIRQLENIPSNKHLNDQATIRLIDLSKIALQEEQVKKLVEAIRQNKDKLILSLQVNLSENNDNLSILAPVFQQDLRSGSSAIFSVHREGVVFEKLKKLITLVGSNINILALNCWGAFAVSNSDFSYDLKTVKELVEHLKQFSSIIQTNLYMAAATIETQPGKSFDEKERQEFMECFLLTEGLHNQEAWILPNAKLLPFDLSLEECRQFLYDFGKNYPERTNKIACWLERSSFPHLTSKEIETLKKETLGLGFNIQLHAEQLQNNQQSGLLLPIDKFSDQDSITLLHHLNSKWEGTTLTLHISILKTDLKVLAEYVKVLNQVKQKISLVLLLSEDMQAREEGKLLDFLLSIKNPQVLEVLYIYGSLKNLGFDELKKLLENICAIPHVKHMAFSQCGLGKRNPKDLIILFSIFKQYKNIKGLYLFGDGILELDLKIVSELLETLQGNDCLSEYALWFGDEVASAKTKWDNESIQFFSKLCQKIWQKNSTEMEKPCYGILSTDQTFEFMRDLLLEHPTEKTVSNVFDWFEKNKEYDTLFDYNQRLTLARLSVQALTEEPNGFDWTAIPFNLNAEHRLELLLKMLEQWEDSSPDFGDDFNLFNDELAVSPLLLCWKTYEDYINSYEKDENGRVLPAEIDLNATFSLIRNDFIPALEKTCSKLFDGGSFFKPCLAKISQFKLNASDIYALKKLENILQWYTWFAVTLIQKKVDMEKIRDSTGLATIFRELSDFTDANLRYQLSRILIDSILANPVGISYYNALTKNMKTLSLVPAILLTRMMVGKNRCVDLEDKKENKEKTETKEIIEKYAVVVTEEASTLLMLGRNILNSLPSAYNDGKFNRVLVGALQALADIPELRAEQKLLLLKALIDATQEPTKSMESAIEATLAKYFAELKSYPQKEKQAFSERLGEVGKAMVSALPAEYFYHYKEQNNKCIKEKLYKILGEERRAFVDELPSKYFEGNKLLGPRELNALHRHIMQELNKDTLKAASQKMIREQMANWYLIQGYGLLKELPSLTTVPTHELKNAIKALFQKIFQLSDEQIKLYQKNIAGKRNEAGLLTYLGKLRSLPKQESDILVQRYASFVQLVLTPDSQDFYNYRYNMELNPHLKNIFSLKPELEKYWKQNIVVDFNDFVKKHSIKAKSFDNNYVKFFQNRIFENHHLPQGSCLELEKYITNLDDVKIRKEIIEHLEQKIVKFGGENKITVAEKNKSVKSKTKTNKNKTLIYLKLQLELIRLLEVSSEDKENQKKHILNAIKVLMTLKPKPEFLYDVEYLLKSLEMSKRKFDIAKTKGWTITFTDHFWSLLLVGTDVETCQRIDGTASYNRCLLAYLLDGKNKLIAIQDETGQTMARCIIRIMFDPKTQTVVLFMEDIYPAFISSEIEQVLHLFAKQLAQNLKLILLSSEVSESTVAYPSTVVSLSTWGPEYVDALGSISETGEFIIPNSYVMHDADSAGSASQQVTGGLYFNWPVSSGSTQIFSAEPATPDTSAGAAPTFGLGEGDGALERKARQGDSKTNH